MKKVFIIMLSAILLFGCSSKQVNKIGDTIFKDNNETKEEPIKDIKIWDVEPIHTFDNIDIDFCLANVLGGWYSYNPTVLVDDGNLYQHHDKGGAYIIKNNHFGLINANGEITVQPGYIGVFKYEDSYQIGDESDSLGFNESFRANNPWLNKDYTLTPSQHGFAPVGATGFPTYIWNEEGYIIEKRWNENGSSQEESKFDIWEFLKGQGIDKDVAVFQIKQDNKNIIVIMKPNGNKVMKELSDCSVHGFSDNVFWVSKDLGEKFKNDDRIPDSFKIFDTMLDTAITIPVYRDDYVQNVRYFDTDGNQIGDTYENGYGFYEGYAAVKKSGKWGYIDKQGNVAVDFIFDKATPLCDGKAWVIYNGRTGRLNIKEMLENSVPFTKETLNVESYEIIDKWIVIAADSIKIRKEPSTSSETVGMVYQNHSSTYKDKKEADGYIWYQIGDNEWIADKDGEWIKELK